MAETIDIGKEGVDHAPQHGHQAVTNVRKQLTLLGPGAIKKGILIRAPGADDAAGGNSGIVYIGGKKVTANWAEGTGGVPIPPGRSITLPACDPSTLYVITDSMVTQDVAWIGF